MAKAKFQAVIGANYGDEGKGRTVDLLTERAPNQVLVVRHNSGAQASHTVVRDGKRHAFSHFGSGTFQRASTILGPNFVINPLGFNREWDALTRMGIRPRVWADVRCRVSTPFDTLVNQGRERILGASHHGSCGVGFGATIERYERLGERARTLLSEVENYERDLDATVRYAKEEFEKLELMSDWHEWGGEDDLVKGFFKQFYVMMGRLNLTETTHLLNFYASEDATVIFEGAQGLLLHQGHPNFPHVTRCRTGLEDVVNLLGLAKITPALEAYYCTRSYITRHGAGPLQNELSAVEMIERGYSVEDATNVPNTWQGSLRYAELDADQVRMQLAEDHTRAMNENRQIPLAPYIALNCLDQAPIRLRGTLRDQLRPAIVALGPSAAESEFAWDEPSKTLHS